MSAYTGDPSRLASAAILTLAVYWGLFARPWRRWSDCVPVHTHVVNEVRCASDRLVSLQQSGHWRRARPQPGCAQGSVAPAATRLTAPAATMRSAGASGARLGR